MQYSAVNWRHWTDAEKARRRAGGRRRYNAIRQRRAEERQLKIVEALDRMGPAAWFSRGLPQAFAGAPGVHPTTVWRDLWQILWSGRETDYVNSEGEILYSVRRAYPGGRVLEVLDPEGRPVRGPERWRIVKSLPRYHGRRR